MSLFRFLGLNPPPPKAARKSNPEYEKKEGKKVPGKMEQERQWRAKRLAHVRLRRGRDALQTLCGACRQKETDRKESFIVGCAVLKLDNIKKHEQTQSHIRSPEIAFAILAPDKTAGQQLRRQLTAAQALEDEHYVSNQSRPGSGQALEACGPVKT